MALILEWSIDTLCHFTTPRKRKMTRSIVYSTKPRMDGFMEAGASVTCTAGEVNIKKGLNTPNASGRNMLKNVEKMTRNYLNATNRLH